MKEKKLIFFGLGDKVIWTSQSAGSEKTKRGVVVLIVHRGGRPSSVKNPGRPRDHESYVVEVKSARSSRVYWPRVSLLSIDKTAV